MFEDLKTDDTIQEEEDSLGGFVVLESGLYDFIVEMAYGIVAASKAKGLAVVLKTADGKELRQTFYMTSGEKKGCKNYFMDKDGNKQYLPGFNLANALCLMTVGKEISQMVAEDKVIELYDPAQGKQVPTPVKMLTELTGKPITAGVLKRTVNKRKKGADGKYVETAETRDENEIDKLFHTKTGLTIQEARAKLTEPVFRDKWKEKWTGVTLDKTKKVVNGPANGAPKSAPASGAGAPVTDLFQ